MKKEIIKKLELSEKEAQALLNIIDIAIKSKGLDLAESGLYFYQKIKNTFNTK